MRGPLFNEYLQSKTEHDARVIAELKKIFEIEGLLSQYGNLFKSEFDNVRGFPVNDYSGLNSLRERMKGHDNRKLDNRGDGRLVASLSESPEKFRNLYDGWIGGDMDCLGSPILFFFRLGTSELTDASQLVNLDEIARVVIQYNLRVRVSGAADSITGNDEINTHLGSERTEFIVKALIDREVVSIS